MGYAGWGCPSVTRTGENSEMRTLIVGAAAAGIAALSVLSPAFGQERNTFTQEAMVDCIRRHGPDLVEGKPGDVRDFVRRPNGDIDFYTLEAVRVGKGCEAQLKLKQTAQAPVTN